MEAVAFHIGTNSILTGGNIKMDRFKTWGQETNGMPPW